MVDPPLRTGVAHRGDNEGWVTAALATTYVNTAQISRCRETKVGSANELRRIYGEGFMRPRERGVGIAFR